MLKKLTIFGALSVLVFVLHVVIGGMLWDGYDHAMHSISDLTATGAPDKLLHTIITVTYAVFSIIFAFSSYLYLKRSVPKLARGGMLVFIAMYLVLLTYAFFPMDLDVSKLTFAGIMHIVITGVILPMTVLAPLLIGFGLKKVEGFKSFGVYCIITGFVILITGIPSAIFFIFKIPYFGLLERISIGTLQLWIFVYSIKLFRINSKYVS